MLIVIVLIAASIKGEKTSRQLSRSISANEGKAFHKAIGHSKIFGFTEGYLTEIYIGGGGSPGIVRV